MGLGEGRATPLPSSAELWLRAEGENHPNVSLAELRSRFLRPTTGQGFNHACGSCDSPSGSTKARAVSQGRERQNHRAGSAPGAPWQSADLRLQPWAVEFELCRVSVLLFGT